MELLKQIEKTRNYLDYIENHVKNVRAAFGVVRNKCSDMKVIYDDHLYSLLEREIYYHDISKLSQEEFIPYRKKFYPVNDLEENDSMSFSKAWEHHKENNHHHWESLNLDSYAWEVDATHMVIDWMAMGYEFDDTAREFYENNKKRIHIPKYVEEYIYEIFDRIEK